MAIFKILRLNKMTCGNRRGLIDMNVQMYGAYDDLYLLPGTHVNEPPNEDVGIITESNTNYKYAGTDALYDYPKNDNKKCAMNIETSVSDLVLNEDQLSIDISSYVSSSTTPYDKTSSDAIQLTPEFWLSSRSRLSGLSEFNSKLSSVRVVYEFEIDTSRNYKAVLSSSTLHT